MRHACAVLVSEARQSKVFEMLKIDEAIIDIWIIIFSSLMNIGGWAKGTGGGGLGPLRLGPASLVSSRIVWVILGYSKIKESWFQK